MHCGLALDRIPVAGPWITDREIELVTEAVRDGWYEGANRHIDAFEQAFARHTGRRFAIALPSCTAAIHLCLAASGVGAGDEVIVPETTWIATAAPVSYVGARPVFADVEADHWCICLQDVELRITSRTRAVIAVDLYGNLADWSGLERLADRHGLLLIADAAEAIGATLAGRPAGAFGKAAVFSFHGSKTLTTGEGGMLVTDDEVLWQRALCLRDHGRRPGDSAFFNSEVAFKYRMSSLQAALGLGQLERIEDLVARKRQIFAWYQDRLAGSRFLLNRARPGSESSYWMTTITWDSGPDKSAVQSALREEGIDTRPFFYPLSELPAYSHLGAQPGPVAARLSRRGLNLPSPMSLTESDADRVCSALMNVFQRL